MPRGRRCGRGGLRLRDRVSCHDPIAPSGVDHVALELLRRLVMGDLHQLLGRDLEERRISARNKLKFCLFAVTRNRFDPIPAYRMPNVTKVLRAMSVVRGLEPRSRMGRQYSKMLRIAPMPMFRCWCGAENESFRTTRRSLRPSLCCERIFAPSDCRVRRSVGGARASKVISFSP